MKKIRLLFLFVCFALLAVMAIFIFKWRGCIINRGDKSVKNVSGKDAIKDINEVMEISDIPVLGLSESADGGMRFIDNGSVQKPVYKGQAISQMQFSPSKKKLGFYYESGNYSSSARDIGLAVMDIGDKSIKKIYEGDYKTSYWEWLNNEEVVVYYGCGSECLAAYIVNIDSGERTAELQYGVGYEWSPDKKSVIAYNYADKYGVTVGDKAGKIIFSLKRSQSAPYDLIYKTAAEWSPDSGKLALIIKKENQNRRELLVFDAQADYERIFQSDVDDYEDMKLNWKGENTVMVNDAEFVL